jgi:hypothetical protein
VFVEEAGESIVGGAIGRPKFAKVRRHFVEAPRLQTLVNFHYVAAREAQLGWS